MPGLLETLERSGGYAAISGLMLLLGYMLARYMLEAQRKLGKEREAEVTRRNDDVLRRADETLTRERENSIEGRHMTDRVIRVVESNTQVISVLVEGQRRQETTLARVDDHLTKIQRVKVPRVTPKNE